jgi:putative membrane protein
MKRIISHKLFALATIVIATNVAWADDSQNSTVTNQMGLLLTPQQFVNDAAMGGMEEVYVSQLALDKSSNEDVKSLANRMIKDHSAANKKLEKIAQDGGYVFPATNTFSAADATWSNPLLTHPENIKGAQMLIMTNMPYLADYQAVQQLKSTPSDQFDRAYLDGLVMDHSATVSEFEAASQSLTDEKLKKFADKTLPTLRKHLQMVRDLDARYSGQNTNAPSSSSAMATPPTTP